MSSFWNDRNASKIIVSCYNCDVFTLCFYKYTVHIVFLKYFLYKVCCIEFPSLAFFSNTFCLSTIRLIYCLTIKKITSSVPIRLLTSVYSCYFEFIALDYENWESIVSHIILHINIVRINRNTIMQILIW